MPRRFLEILSGTNSFFRNGSGRLELAQAITHPKNPLTPRVIVNRVWMQHFGAGIVKTPDDFGNQSEPPSHLELLDWLSNWFMENGWSLKKLHREIMLSSKNLLKPADGAAVVNPSQDIVLGCYYITYDKFPDEKAIKNFAATMQDEAAYAKRALDAGATGFILTDMADADLVPAVLRAGRGERFESPAPIS